MSQISYNNEKVAKKKVLLYNNTGSELVIRGGYAVCYDHSQTDLTQAYRVVKPETNNLLWFAGVIIEECDGFKVAAGASRAVTIYIPTKYGQIVPVWINEDHSANIALLELVTDSWALTEGATAAKVARSVQLVNRSVINGTCLARLYGHSDPLA